MNVKPITPFFDSIGFLCVIGFLSLLVNHLQIGMSQPEETDIAITPEELADGFREGIEWHAIYLREAKVGFSKLERRVTPDGFVLKQMMRLNMTVMRQDQVLTVSVKTHLNRDYTLKSFDLRMDNPAAPFAAVGRVDGTLVNVALTMGSYTERKKIQLDKAPMVELGVRPLLMQKNLEEGQRYAMKYFDPLSLSEKEMSIVYLGTSKMNSLGEDVEAHHLRRYIGDQVFDAWVNDLGEVLDERLPLGYIAIRETEAEATYGVMRYEGTVQHDVVEKSAIHANEIIGDLNNASQATWAFNGIDPSSFNLNGHRQRVEPTETGHRMTIERHHQPSLLTETERAAYLADSSMLSINHPKLQAAARDIKTGANAGEGVGPAVVDWVFKKLKKKPVVSLPSAVQVLEMREGDCNEHATLAVALLRAAGVPARLASGLAFLDGKFLFHAWVEYHDGARWVSADPTWGQEEADVGHVRFLWGGIETQLALLQVVGNLKIDTLTWEQQP